MAKESQSTAPIMRDHTKAAFDNIMETFASANTPFLNFMFMVRQLDKQAADGDKGAEQILKIMLDFNKLILVASDPKYQKKA